MTRQKHVYTFEKRNLIEKLIFQKYTLVEISKIINVSLSSLKKEIRLCGHSKWEYKAEKAQANYVPPYGGHEFSEEEKKKIKEWIEEGKGLHYMRKQLSCGYERLKNYFTTENIDTKSITLTNIGYRLDALEQHIKMIYEELYK